MQRRPRVLTGFLYSSVRHSFSSRFVPYRAFALSPKRPRTVERAWESVETARIRERVRQERFELVAAPSESGFAVRFCTHALHDSQDPRMSSRIGPGMRPRIGPGMRPRIGPGMRPRIGPGMRPGMRPRIGPRILGSRFNNSNELGRARDPAVKRDSNK